MIALLAAEVPSNVIEWFTDGSSRTADGAIPDQVWVTMWHALVATGASVLIAVPIAALLAHFRRAEILSSAIVNVGRVIPTITIVGVALIAQLRAGWGLGPGPIILALVFLTLPPIFANTYAAIRGVAPEAVAASRAMGLTEGQVLRQVELPLGAALILTGIRVAMVQALATEVIGAFFAGDGIGVYLRQGLRNQNMPEVQAGALLVTGVATAVDLVLWLVARSVAPTTERRTPSGRRRLLPTSTSTSGAIDVPDLTALQP